MFAIGTRRKDTKMEENGPSWGEILEYLPAATYTCDPRGVITGFNEAAVRLWGKRPVAGKDLWCGSWKSYHSDGTPMAPDQSPMARTIKEGKVVNETEFIIEHPDASRIYVRAHPRPIFDKEGTLTGAVGMLFEIAGQGEKTNEQLQEAIERLKRSEERNQHMVSEIQDYAIILLSREGNILNWNKGAEKIKGYSTEEIIGKNFRIFYLPEDRQNLIPDKLIDRALKSGRAVHEGWRVKKDGSKFWGSITITALHDSRQNVTGFVKVTRDLTERKLQQEKAENFTREILKKNELLRQSEERYNRMLAEVEDYAILLLDTNGNIQNWNKGAEKIKGYTADEIIGKNFSIFYTEQDRQKEFPRIFLDEAAKKGKVLHEGWRLRKDGTAFWGSLVLTALHDTHGKLIGFSKVTRDLTERKVADEKLVQSSLNLEKKNKELERMNEELSSFAYISSHDLQEPLRKIQTFSDRIMELEYNNLSEKGKDYFHRMLRGAMRMQNLIRDILAYSRMSTAEKTFELTDLDLPLSQSKTEMEVMIMEKKATIENTPMPTLKVIPFQIQQLFSNLLNNALKFSKPGVPPHIIITSDKVKNLEVPGIIDPVKHYCHIAIRDNGIGFDPAYGDKIFEVFQRLHGRSEYGGTGIGLAICKKIVENHHGVIKAEGRENEGATFHVFLPAEDEAAPINQ